MPQSTRKHTLTRTEAGATSLACRRQSQAGCEHQQDEHLEAQGAKKPAEQDTEVGVMGIAGQRGVTVH